MMDLTWFQSTMTLPTTVAPEWAEKVERWYQLDAAAFALSETYWRHRAALERHPQWLLLASPQGSNLTDVQFAKGPSPARFVHTLPNVRGASLLQVMNWTGRVLCLQNDPATILTAIGEGMHLPGDVWIAGMQPKGDREERGFTGHIFVLSANSQHGTLKIVKNSTETRETPLARDKDFLSWLNLSTRTERDFVANGFRICAESVVR